MRENLAKFFIFLVITILKGQDAMGQNLESITVGGGCFWCIEAVFQDINGVEKAVSGYSGGDVENPSYEQVSTGLSNHAEVVQITFNPEVISTQKILEVFFHLHDPTTLNKQGADIGTQYRSIILFSGENQKQIAQQAINEIEKQKLYSNKVVTQVVPLVKFYPAEEYHQNYFKNNKNNRYCQLVVAEKVAKVHKLYAELFKK